MFKSVSKDDSTVSKVELTLFRFVETRDDDNLFDKFKLFCFPDNVVLIVETWPSKIKSWACKELIFVSFVCILVLNPLSTFCRAEILLLIVVIPLVWFVLIDTIEFNWGCRFELIST